MGKYIGLVSALLALAFAAGVVVAPTFQEGLLAAASPPLSTDAPAAPVRLTEEGDEIRFHMRIFDNRARLLYSTAAADRPELEENQNASDSPFMLPLSEEDTPQRHFVTSGIRPVPFDDSAAIPVGGSLLGKPVGHIEAWPFVGRMTGFTDEIELPRLRGPFNLTLTIRTETLDNLTSVNGDDEIVLDDLFHAKVLERHEESSTIRLLLKDGERLQVRRAPFEAEILLDEAADQFHVRLHATEGDQFSLLETCRFARYVLNPGTYRVLEISEEAIRLASSPTRWPQLIDQDLIMVLEITEIVDRSE